MICYLDNASTTKPYPEVIEVMNNAPWGNANSITSPGIEAKIAINKVANQLLSVLGVSKETHMVTFTNGGSEANRLAHTYSKYRIIPSNIEHKSMLYGPNRSPSRLLVDKNGQIYFDRIYNQFKALLYFNSYSVMYINNEIGVINEPDQLATQVKATHIDDRRMFMVDMVQTLGKHSIDLSSGLVDIATFSAHKIHGPKGVGAVVSRNSLDITQPTYTLNVPGIVGFGKAIEMINIERDLQYVTELRNIFLETLNFYLGYKLRLNCPIHLSTPYILSIDTGVDGETLMNLLDQEGIIISLGSACNTKDIELSHVLVALSLSDKQIQSTIRVSFSNTNNINEVKEAAIIIAANIKKLSQDKIYDSIRPKHHKRNQVILGKIYDALHGL